MQFSEILSSLPTFSAVELFELETVVTRLLIDSGFEKTLRPALRVGHIVEYFHSGYREVSEGVIRYLAEDTVTLYDYEAGSDVTVPYFAIVVPDPLQTPQTSIPPRPPYPDAQFLEIGELVAFLDMHNRVQVGQMLEKNDVAIDVICEKKIVQVLHQDWWEAHGVNY